MWQRWMQWRDLQALFLGLLTAVLVATPLQTNAYTVWYQGGAPVRWNADAPWRLKSSYIGLGPEASLRARDAINGWNSVPGWFDFTPETSSASNGFAAFNFGNNLLGSVAWNWDGVRHYTYWEVRLNTNITNWSFSPNPPPSNRFDALTLLRHELGHAAGLCHSGNESLLMGFTINQGERLAIDSDAQNGFRFLYDATYSGPGPESASCP